MNCSMEEAFELQGLNMEETNVVAIQLRKLNIVHLPKLKHVWNKDPLGILTFPNLRMVYIWDCWCLKNLFPPSIARVHPLLKDLKIYSCGVEEIVSKEEGLEVDIAFEFHQASSLILWNLPKLKCFYPGKHTTKWPMLAKLETYHCNDIMILGTENQNVQEMNGGQPESPMKPPLFLVEKEIVGDGGHEGTDDIVFSNLKFLELQHLPNLTSFCSGNHTFEFPSLEQVIVSQCPELKFFCRGVLYAPLLRRVQVSNKDDKGPWVGDLNSTIQQLYAEKVGFQGIEYCVLSEFSKSIEIWNENLRGVLNFRNLKILEVHGCNSLKYMFTSSMALDLLQLKEIKVKNCLVMEHIIVTNDGEEAPIFTVMFPWLQFITLESCSNLLSFYLGTSTLQCPSLEEIVLVDCPKMFAFASTFSREQGPAKLDGGNLKRNGA